MRPFPAMSRRARATAWLLPLVIAWTSACAGAAGTPSAGVRDVEPAASTTAPSAAAAVGPSAEPGARAEVSCALPAYPTEACTGVPPGWVPAVTHEGTLTITTDGAVIEDYQVNGDIDVQARDVTIRRTRVYGGGIDNFTTDVVFGHLTLEDVEVTNPPGETSSENFHWAIGTSDYTCRRCKVMYRNEGWRIGGQSYKGQGPVTIEDSFARLSTPPGACEASDPHGDGIQAYDGPAATIHHTTIDQRLDPCPTTALFIPDQGNNGAIVTDNLLAGGGWTLTLLGGKFPTVTGNKIVDGEWGYGPLDVDCNLIGRWQGNAVVTVDWTQGRVVNEVRPLTLCG